jgi:hypothetical protein
MSWYEVRDGRRAGNAIICSGCEEDNIRIQDETTTVGGTPINIVTAVIVCDNKNCRLWNQAIPRTFPAGTDFVQE